MARPDDVLGSDNERKGVIRYALLTAINNSEGDQKMRMSNTLHALAACMLFGNIASGQDGLLDNTFGNGGTITTRIGPSNDECRSVALQPDGKIVAAGWTYNGSSNDFAVVRYNPDGTLDNTFGAGGIVITANGQANSVAVQPDGKIIIAGTALARYNTNGTLDGTFGGGGVSTAGSGQAMALQPDGKIILVGTAITRCNVDGTLDDTFGSGGSVATPLEGHAVALQSDNGIVIAGWRFNGSNDDFAIARYLPNGTPDSLFGTGGMVMTDISQDFDVCNAVALQSDGKIVVAGSAHLQGDKFAMARYNSNGMLDNTFGNRGIVTNSLGIGGGQAYALALQPGGKLIVAGWWTCPHTGRSGDTDPVAARYNADGTRDSTFGTQGVVQTHMGWHDVAYSLAFDDEGRIIVAGSSWNGPSARYDYDFAVQRYIGNSSPLPIQLVSFTGSITGQNQVRLDWSTLSESNNFGFEIQKSTADAPASFHSVPGSFTPGHGTTNIPQQYAYMDTSAYQGVWYYRLKQIDLDGTERYTHGIRLEIITAVAEQSAAREYLLDQNYPNPFNASTVIKFNVAASEFVRLNVFDITGQQVAQLVNETLAPGTYEARLDGTNLASGVYYYRLHTGGFARTRKLVLEK